MKTKSERAWQGQVERRLPARPASLEADVVVPALQALITGIVAAVLSMAIAGALHVPRWPTVGLAVGVLAWGLAWAWLLRDHQALLWQVERTTGLDLDRDGDVGPPPKPRVVTAEVIEHQPRRIRYVDVPLSDEELKRLAHAVLGPGAEFSRRQLPDGLLSTEQYGAVVEAMTRGGLLVWRGRGPNAGVELTGAGRAFLRQWL